MSEAAPLHVVATAGHVDHGKSSIIAALTGIDPDRWAEEKRRGLTIDIGFAWTALPSGREVGFVDVPGHERFVRNMLAGVGPVKLVLLVVAADEGWKPQTEEHLAIVDVLGAEGGVVALSKRDLVGDDAAAEREADVRQRLAGTALAAAPIVETSVVAEGGLDALREALDDLVGTAPTPPDHGRPRIHVDRSFSIRGAGTVVTGTLTGGRLGVGDEVRLYPGGATARVRSLQTHRRAIEEARPVSRVAANLAATSREEAERGDVLGLPGQWRPTTELEVRLRTVRSLGHPLTTRGAFKLYVGAAERDATVRLYNAEKVPPGAEALARLRLARPVVAEVGDRFVLREAGRRETVGGGVILDPHPPRRPGPDPAGRLGRREGAEGPRVAEILVAERGAVRAADLPALTGAIPDVLAGAERVGAWWVARETLAALATAASTVLDRFHASSPLLPGLEAAEVRRALLEARPDLSSALEQGLAAEVLERVEAEGAIAREGTILRIASHTISLGADEEAAGRLVGAVTAGEPAPPTVRELAADGFALELIDAACAVGRLVRVSPDLVFTPGFMERAEGVARAAAAEPDGLTVSGYRQLLGTTRKFALPLLEHLDANGVTRRDGDVRRLG
ncbi:MAG TPA: selenocysteine-specific translation elongation factor [Actinomycetota bacterium]